MGPGTLEAKTDPLCAVEDDMQNNETGFTFQGCSPDEIARAMAAAVMAENPDTERIKKNCRQLIINKHSHEYAAHQWRQILESIQQKKS